MPREERTSVIRRLNDELRCCGAGGRVLITAGVEALGAEAVAKIMQAVASFDSFHDGNDPHREHDCAILSVDGRRIIWKIDYYDLKLAGHSPDPADPSVTVRVMTVMLAEEY